jgi:hypothetical protein
MPHLTPPPALAGELRRLTTRELSLPSRLRYVGVLLAASAMAATVTALLVTEAALPTRTTIALGALAFMAACWMAFAAWVLIRRRVLLGSHRVVAGRLAVTFSTIFVVGALAIGFTTSARAPFAAAAMGTVMLSMAIATLIRARRQVADLARRRDELQRLLRGGH